MITRGFELGCLYDKKVQLLAVLSITKQQDMLIPFQEWLGKAQPNQQLNSHKIATDESYGIETSQSCQNFISRSEQDVVIRERQLTKV